MRSHIEDHALIGDLHTSALISNRGTLSWLCLPHFDSEACFASLLGTNEQGEWSLSPKTFRRVDQRYLPGTLIVETTYTQHSGAVASVTDFMTVQNGLSSVVRIVRGIKGIIRFRSAFCPRFDYGAGRPRIAFKGKTGWCVVSGPHRLTLRSNVELRCGKGNLEGDWSAKSGKSYYFTLQYDTAYSGKEPAMFSPHAAQQQTARDWKKWITQSKYRGPHRSQVERSLITLKALTYAPSGGLVAAPTTSLPEKVGGVRNWDYRFCWLRDTTFSLECLLECGLMEDARAWLGWLSRSVQGDPSNLKIMYGITGKHEHSEWVADWLPGYERSKPVHIGNKASSQLQIDTYGEVLDALYRARRHGLYPHEDKSGAALELPLLEHLEKIWSDPDNGMWEFRPERRQFTQSKVMAWVAFDRGLRMVEEFGIKGPVDRWRRIRKQIHAEICKKGFHQGMNSFTQAYGTKHLDASLLLMPIVGFLPIEDQRVAGTVRAIERHLMHKGLLLRYDTRQVIDGLPAGEGAFLACNFWLVEVYILQGRLKEARAHFEKLLRLGNSLGLFAEEYDKKHGLVGNFPQAFSHVGLLNAALSLAAGTSVRLRNLTEPAVQRKHPSKRSSIRM